MSAIFSGNVSGSFISDGTAKLIELPTGYDRIETYNVTQWKNTVGSGQAIQCWWQVGDDNGGGHQITKTASTLASVASDITANQGFFYYDGSDQTPGAQFASNGTGVTGDTPPQVTTAAGVPASAGLVEGSVVRMYNVTGGTQLNGYDFTVGTVANTYFELAYMPTIVATSAVCNFRKLVTNPLFYPSTRNITAIRSKPTDSTVAQITLSVTHNLTVGQKVRFVIPEVQGSTTYFGMTQLDGLEGAIVAVGEADANGYTNTITVDIDVSGFTAFTFPVTGLGTFTPAQIVPLGQDTAVSNLYNVNPFAGARNNQSVRGVVLQAGKNSPAGQLIGSVGDTIRWIAYKSF